METVTKRIAELNHKIDALRDEIRTLKKEKNSYMIAIRYHGLGHPVTVYHPIDDVTYEKLLGLDGELTRRQTIKYVIKRTSPEINDLLRAIWHMGELVKIEHRLDPNADSSNESILKTNMDTLYDTVLASMSLPDLFKIDICIGSPINIENDDAWKIISSDLEYE